MENLVRDIRFSLRNLARSPGFTTIIVATLALGIGANAAIFSVVNGMLLASLPYEKTEELLNIWGSKPSRGWTDVSVSIPDFEDWRERSRAFEQMAAYQGQSYNLSVAEQPIRVRGEQVSANLFRTLGNEPLLGRDFTPEEGATDTPVTLLSHQLWTLSFGQDPNIVGSELRLDGVPHAVIGVMPPQVDFPRDTSLWVPTSFPEVREERGHRGFGAIARLAPGVTVDQARDDMKRIASDLEREYPDENAGWSVNLVPITGEALGNDLEIIMAVLSLAVGFVLLLVCVNTASLLLSRAVARQKEVALRVALGAGRRRLLAQLLTESLLLAVFGGALGIAVAHLGVRTLVTIAPPDAPRIDNVTVDTTVLAYTLGISLLSGLLFGLVPALQASRPNLTEALADTGRTSGGASRHRLLRGLVAAEVGLALALLALGILMVRSFEGMLREDPGFHTADLLTARLTLPESKYPDDASRNAFFDRVLEDLRAMQGVESATAVHTLPLGGSNSWRGFTVEGRPVDDPEGRESIGYLIAREDYFEALDIPLLQGRAFDASDVLRQAAVTVVNRTAAERYWPELDTPVGQRLCLCGPDDSPKRWLEVIGVAADVKHSDLSQPPRPEVYAPYPEQTTRAMTLVLETHVDPGELAPALRATVLAVDPDQPLYDVRSMSTVLAERSADRRALAQILGSLALGALVLAAIGIYGVLAFTIGQRRYEIGIRRAMGAQHRDILALTLRLAATPVAVGILVGVGLALGLGQAVRSLIAGISPSDPTTYALAVAVIAGVALGAALLPARRAARLDPLRVLRHD
jgi:putative ABC transport system permease protein